jgi:predicted RNA methylase
MNDVLSLWHSVEVAFNRHTLALDALSENSLSLWLIERWQPFFKGRLAVSIQEVLSSGRVDYYLRYPPDGYLYQRSTADSMSTDFAITLSDVMKRVHHSALNEAAIKAYLDSEKEGA